jgi:hypothetical protein
VLSYLLKILFLNIELGARAIKKGRKLNIVARGIKIFDKHEVCDILELSEKYKIIIIGK